MSDTIILHHDDPSHAAAVARGEAVSNPADLLPGDVLLSRWAPGRYITVTAPARHFYGYLAVEYQTEDGKCGTLNVRADVNPHARRPMIAAAPEQAGLVQVHGQACACQLCERPAPAVPTDHAWRNANGIHRTDCRLDGTVRSDASPCDNCHKPWEGHTVADCGGIRCDQHVPAGNPWPKTPAMTRAQFEYLARILFEAHREEAIEGPMTVARMVAKFAYHLADTNARFDAERFIAAAIR